MHQLAEKVCALFSAHFQASPTHIARAPGRVNLIGEHTDYNEGFVFPMAIDRAVWIAFKPNNKHYINVMASDFATETFSADLSSLQKGKVEWLEYLKGVAHVMQQHFNVQLKGFDAVILSDVPIGAGLSSSAALELATARAFAACNDITWDAVLMAKLAQRAENEWVGVNCGIMDQLISAVGQKDHAVLIDCRNLHYEAISLPKETAIVIMDTSTRRGLVHSAYNERREQCNLAAAALNISSLRDAKSTDVRQLLADENMYKRAKHVVTENERSLGARESMLCNDAVSLGLLFNQSHQSLDEDYEVTNEALNIIVAIASAEPGCYGARMTGAGFGGCAVALVARESVDDFCDAVTEKYKQQTQLDASVFAVSAEEGVSLVQL